MNRTYVFDKDKLNKKLIIMKEKLQDMLEKVDIQPMIPRRNDK